MLDEIFILFLYLALASAFYRAFRSLPSEHWQMIGTFPVRRLPGGDWMGWNLTWYGFFNASSVLLATALFMILMGSVSVPPGVSLAILFILLAVCLPAAKFMARLVEKRHGTFTVGGAFFVGVLIAPFIIRAMSHLAASLFGIELPVMQTLSAMAIAYALGEGTGRLACISFGCCYGKPLADCSPRLQRIFARHYFIFTGKTKKIAYEHHLDGVKVLPVQGLTCIIFSVTGLVGCYLFLKGFPFTAFLMTLLFTQVWRIVSETLRADYRGNGKISAYQVMAGAAILYVLPMGYLFKGSAAVTPSLASGLMHLAHPVLILLLSALWAVILIYMGKSKVTSAVIHYLPDQHDFSK